MNHIKFGDTYVAHNVNVSEHEKSIECVIQISENPDMNDVEELTNNFRAIDTSGIIVTDDDDSILAEYYGYTRVDTLKIEDGVLTIKFSKIDDMAECITDIYKRIYHIAMNNSGSNNITALSLLRRAEELTTVMIAERIR